MMYLRGGKCYAVSDPELAKEVGEMMDELEKEKKEKKKNNCVNIHCVFFEEDGSCDEDIQYCKEYIPSSSHEALVDCAEAFTEGLTYGLKSHENFQKLDENVTKLEQLSGHSLDTLLEMFAAGWMLEPPKKSVTVEELWRRYLDCHDEIK